jgi:hypothetical protein
VDGTTAEFRVPAGTLAAKPCLRGADSVVWACGYDVPLTGAPKGQDLHPQFLPPAQGTVSERLLAPRRRARREHHMRVYLPPGYAEQPTRRYPVIYMHDGANLFFPHEAFAGQTWQVQQTMDLLIGTGLVPPAIVVAHGGTIAVQSALGAGTCFTIRLPATPAPTPGPEPPVPAEAISVR